MKILAIETSCDETSAAVVEDGVSILSNIISSQIDIHARYGGVVPEVASRQHLLSVLPVIKSAMETAHVDWSNLAGVAVTYGPGLAGSLLVGVNVAKAIALTHQLPLLGINHLEGHLYSNWLYGQTPLFPCLCLIASGGHSDLVLMKDHGDFHKIGQTRDDAAGEAFDKGARILEMGYPGGPAIEAAAKNGLPELSLPRAWLKGTYDFSFSGVKTALLHLAQAAGNTDDGWKANAAASYQQAIIDVLVTKTIQAAHEHNVRQILLAGGVAANRTLGTYFRDHSSIEVLIPPPILCTDNAAMIASCGYFHLKAGNTQGFDLDVIPNLAF